MKSLITLLEKVLTEVGKYSSVATSLDLKTIQRRFDNEGLRFLAADLPILSQGLLRGLAEGKVTPDLFPGFRCRGNLPVLLGGFFELIFDRSGGTLLDEPDIQAIRSIQQVTLLFKKIELKCSEDKIQAALNAFVECDIEVGIWEQSVDCGLLVEFHQLSSLLYSSVFLQADRKIRDYEVVPKHGPGATADRLLANAKYTNPKWSHEVEDVFPYWLYATTKDYDSSVYDGVSFEEPGAQTPAKVVDVPKTWHTPRIIAEEPTYKQYLQQGVMALLKEGVDSSYLESLIGTTSQEPNQLLALEGSITGELATLDLSEASDRVSNLLVMTLTANFPHLHDAVQATRSAQADVPGFGVIDLNRFSSMGSALCFPIESMVFLTIVLLGMQDAKGSRLTEKDIKLLIGKVRVYGDDIVVPTYATRYVIDRLEAFGLKVNRHKSFWTGKFRESCGKEYYAGEDVTICRVRNLLPSSRTDVDQVVSASSFRNQAYWRGLWETAGWLDELLSSFMPYPVVADSSIILGRQSVLGIPAYKLCPKLHVPLVGGMVVRYRRHLSEIDGAPALMKTLGFTLPVAIYNRDDWAKEPYGPFIQVETDADHLVYAGRPEAARLKFRIAPAY
jgi:hypothetical protein